MRKTLWLAAAAAILTLPAIAHAVPQLPERAQASEEAALAEFVAAVEQMRAELLRPGEHVEGWDVGGADPDRDLRTRGADRHYFLTRTREGGTIVSILSDRPITDFAPAGWRVVDRYGSPETPLASPQLDFVPLSSRYVFASRTQFQRRRDVDCSTEISDALLYELPGAPSSPQDADMPILFRMMLLALEGQELCVRTDGDAQSGYRSRVFLPDGRLLPELFYPDDLSTIVAAAPIDQLIELFPTPTEPGGTAE